MLPRRGPASQWNKLTGPNATFKVFLKKFRS